ncbi:hypothetical protein B0O80DRAFT_439576 [Mortierella sp. GBAus27b]|nr:hypothetical protein BGX31_010705 [Mortierella sp. GBA43]KAI8360553.1 hypothetical protein B0O80DRAFT_439576 [Mortierella sp. GBAus27b]
MRTSVLVAIASALVAVAVAHPGHDEPVSVCLSTPTNATCSNYTIPASNITTAISDICKTASYLPGCSLNTACSADSKLNATYCAPLTVLASLCKPTDDAAVTSAVCSKTYGVFCADNSLIPGCKSQPAFPGLPSGKAVTGAVYSVCQEMPSMTGCTICPAPDATGYSKCDEVKAWKDLCLDMPEMSQCPSYNTMCNSTKFAPFCDSKYRSPAGGGVTPPPSGGDHSGHVNQPSGASMVVGSWAMSSLLAMAAGAMTLVL